VHFADCHAGHPAVADHAAKLVVFATACRQAVGVLWHDVQAFVADGADAIGAIPFRTFSRPRATGSDCESFLPGRARFG